MKDKEMDWLSEKYIRPPKTERMSYIFKETSELQIFTVLNQDMFKPTNVRAQNRHTTSVTNLISLHKCSFLDEL